MLPLINIDDILQISQHRPAQPLNGELKEEVTIGADSLSGGATPLLNDSSIRSNVATPGTSPFVTALSAQQYRNTETMQPSFNQLGRESSIEDYETDDSSKRSDLHIRDMVTILNIFFLSM